jgi:hypothetical protein
VKVLLGDTSEPAAAPHTPVGLRRAVSDNLLLPLRKQKIFLALTPWHTLPGFYVHALPYQLCEAGVHASLRTCQPINMSRHPAPGLPTSYRSLQHPGSVGAGLATSWVRSTRNLEVPREMGMAASTLGSVHSSMRAV